MARANLLVGVLASLLVAACAAATPTTPAPVRGATAPVGSPVTGIADLPGSAAPASQASSRATARAPDVAGLTWARAGKLDVGDGDFLGLYRLPGGYVAWGHAYPDGADPDEEDHWLLATWWSADLRSWTRTLHRSPVAACEGWTPGPELEGESVGADDTTLVIVAAQAAPDATVEDGCNRNEIIALSTHDGLTWTRSGPFRPTGPDAASSLQALGPWRIPRGWETHIGPLTEAGAAVWQTEDLLTWRQVGVVPDAWGGGVQAVAGDGTRLTESDASDRPTLVASSDGVAWRTVRTLPQGSWVSQVLPPVRDDNRWVAALEREGRKARLLSSRDLTTWEGSAFPSAGVETVLRTADGWIATGYTPNPPPMCEGDICGMEVPEQFHDAALYTSGDGRTWTKHPESQLPKGRMPFLVADGSAVLAIDGLVQGNGVIRFWRLTGGG